MEEDMNNTGASAEPTGLSQQAAEPVVSALTGFDPSRIMELSAKFGEREAAKVADRVDANELERSTIGRLERLVRHGYKFIDIVVRKDGQQFRFEGDWIARLFDPSRGEWEAALASAGEAFGRDGETRLDAKASTRPPKAETPKNPRTAK